MRLPGSGASCGPSDLVQYTRCARAYSFSIERWDGGGERPEAGSAATAYGSFFHRVAEVLDEKLCSHDEALDEAWAEFCHDLEPEALDRARGDLEVYESRDLPEHEVIGNEVELSMPLFEQGGETYYLRGRLDRLYRDRRDPTRFIVRDLKTGMNPPSQAEIDRSIQARVYEALVAYTWPEATSIEVRIDYLQFGEMKPPPRSERDRKLIVEWATRTMKAIRADERVGHDGRGVPHWNNWCGFCPLIADCPVIDRLTTFSKEKIAAEMDSEKIGRKTVTSLKDPDVERHAELAKTAGLARRTLESYDEKIKELLKVLPDSELEKHGWKRQSKSANVFREEAMPHLMRLMGERAFLQSISITQAAVKRAGLSEDDEKKALALMEKVDGAASLVVRKS